jgi:hypothetical protein
MIRQYFAELDLEEGISLSEGLQELVEEAEESLESEFIEVHQVIRHDEKSFTVIINIDYVDSEDMGERLSDLRMDNADLLPQS